MKFEVGDVVAWDQVVAPMHGKGSIIRRESLPNSPVGKVISVANEEGTWFEVEFEGGNKILTNEEIVKVEV